jgi:flavodoxin short chain
MADVLIVYWSGTGNTEMMAEKIKEGLENNNLIVEMATVDEVNPSDVNNYEKILLGCPSMGEDELEDTEFEPFFEEVTRLISGKHIGLFGSYGWGEGEWMKIWETRVKTTGANLFQEGLMVNYTPTDEDNLACIAFGEAFAKL